MSTDFKKRKCANAALKWVTFLSKVISGQSVIRSSFWRTCPFQPIPFWLVQFGKQNANPPVTERKFTVPTIKGNHYEWQHSYFVYEKSPSNIQTSMFSLRALNNELYYGRGNKTVGRFYFSWVRENRNEMSLLFPWKLFLLPSTLTSSMSMGRTLLRPGSIFAYSHNHKHVFFSICAAMFSIHIISGKSF